MVIKMEEVSSEASRLFFSAFLCLLEQAENHDLVHRSLPATHRDDLSFFSMPSLNAQFPPLARRYLRPPFLFSYCLPIFSLQQLLFYLPYQSRFSIYLFLFSSL